MKHLLFLVLIFTFSGIHYCFSQQTAEAEKIPPPHRNKYRVQFKKKSTLDISGGSNSTTRTMSSFAEKGYNTSIVFHQFFNPNFSLGLGSNFSNFSTVPEYQSNANWKNISIGIGPEYSFYLGRFIWQFYTRIGAAFVKTPELISTYPKSKVITQQTTASNSTVFDGKIGTNLAFSLSRKFRLFFSTEYSSNIGNSVSYQSRDVSEAINKDRIDPDRASEIPFQDEDFGLSFFSFNLGLSFDLISKPSTRAQDLNNPSSKTSGISPPSGGNNPQPIQANDWNSTRSNKTSKTSRVINPDGNDNNGETPLPTQANDWNSTRSNKTSKTSSIINPNGNDNNGETPLPTQATDWNSTRSNKTSKTTRMDNPDGNDNNTEFPQLAMVIERLPSKGPNFYISMSDKELETFNKLSNQEKKLYFSNFVSKVIKKKHPKENINKEDIMQAVLSKWCGPCPLIVQNDVEIITVKKNDVMYKIYFSNHNDKIKDFFAKK